jgi:hypothetical protein
MVWNSKYKRFFLLDNRKTGKNKRMKDEVRKYNILQISFSTIVAYLTTFVYLCWLMGLQQLTKNMI